jgi:hypothetical protein
MSAIEQLDVRTTQVARIQARRAWAVMLGSLVVFMVLASGVIAAGRFYWEHATTREAATLQVVSGSGALVRSPGAQDWRLVTTTTSVHEGDRISTALGTVVWLTMFDGSTVEVSEDTILKVARMRSSRYLKSTKHFILEPERGTVYVAMAPHGDYDYVEFTVRASGTSITMADEAGSSDAGSFLFEAITAPAASNGASDTLSVRAAVLRGAATLTTPRAKLRLTADQQTLVGADGVMGPITQAVRELVQDGDFSGGLGEWVSFQQQAPESAGAVASGASVELVTDHIGGRDVTAAEFLRGATHDDIAQAGIRQRIGTTLRVYSSLRLEFDAKITDQRPMGGGADESTFPLTIRLIYIDVDGQELEWEHGYYIYADPTHPVPTDRATKIDADTWQHTVFDLRSLSPLPRQITTLVVYASGGGYQTRVANISLTSSELQTPQQ